MKPDEAVKTISDAFGCSKDRNINLTVAWGKTITLSLLNTEKIQIET